MTRSPRYSTKMISGRALLSSPSAARLVVDPDRRRPDRERGRRADLELGARRRTLALTCPSSTTSRSPSRDATVPRMMLLSPMKEATSSFSGFVEIVSGSAICWIRPSCMTTIRSAIERDSSWLCVTWTNMRPSWRCRFRSSTRMRSCSRRSRSPSGSSSRSAFGLVTSTRASATRCCCPPESARGLRSASCERPTISSVSMARRRRSSFATRAS